MKRYQHHFLHFFCPITAALNKRARFRVKYLSFGHFMCAALVYFRCFFFVHCACIACPANHVIHDIDSRRIEQTLSHTRCKLLTKTPTKIRKNEKDVKTIGFFYSVHILLCLKFHSTILFTLRPFSNKNVATNGSSFAETNLLPFLAYIILLSFGSRFAFFVCGAFFPFVRLLLYFVHNSSLFFFCSIFFTCAFVRCNHSSFVHWDIW